MVNNKGKRKNVQSNGSDSDIPEAEHDINDPEERRMISVFERKMRTIVRDLQAQLQSKDTVISKLEEEVSKLKKKFVTLENKIEDTEAYERRDTVILSGSAVPLAADNEESTKVVTDIIKERVGVIIKPSDISVAHRLGKKPDTQAPDRRNIIVKLCRREIKQDLIKACKAVRPKNLFINESLTHTRNTALYGLRQAKKKFPDKVAGCGSYDGKVHVWLKPPNPQAPMARNSKMIINTRDRFNELCENILKCASSDLINNWPN